MKSIFKSIAFASLALTLSLSCAREEIGGPELEDGQMELTVTGVLGEYEAADDTKASLVNTLRVEWTKNDIVYVFQKSNGTYVGALTADNDGKVAKLTGTITSGSGELVFVYSNALSSAPSPTDGVLDISLASQGAATPFVVYGTATPGTTKPSGLVVNFSFATSVISAYASGLPASTSITVGLLEGAGINTVCSLNIKDGGAPSGNTVGAIKKAGSLGTSNSAGQAMVQFAVPACPSGARTIVLTVGNKYGAILVGTDVLSSATAYSAIAPMGSKINGYEYVEIGGLYWAKTNIGAATVNDFGDKYSWGETTTKPKYSIGTYTAGDISTDLSETNDAAHVNLGSSWRIPTINDFINLDNACGGSGGASQPISAIASSNIEGGKVKKGRYWLAANQSTLSSIDELKYITAAGILFSDGNNYLFFPAAGNIDGTSTSYGGTHGYYWSSTCSSNASYAYMLYFYSSNVNPQSSNGTRYYGRSVRPVMDY